MVEKFYSFIVSGYGNDNEKTLKIYKMDSLCRDITEVSSAMLTNPTYAAYSGCSIYTLSEVYEDDPSKSPLYLLKMLQSKLPVCSKQEIDSTGIVYLEYSKKYKTLFGACYGSGDVFSVGVEGNSYTGVKSMYRLPPAEDGISRAHCAQLDTHSKFLFATNFYTDKIYSFFVRDGYLIPNRKYPYLSLNDKTGPRHIVFHKTKPIAYITCETSNEVIVVKEDVCTGELTIIQRISTLPPDYSEKSYVSNGFITPDGKHFLVANRGANDIVTYDIDCNGKLTYSSTASCYGNWPRHIDCTKDGKYIFICNQKSNDLVIAPLNKAGQILSPCKTIEFNGCAFALDN